MLGQKYKLGEKDSHLGQQEVAFVQYRYLHVRQPCNFIYSDGMLLQKCIRTVAVAVRL